MYTDSLDSQPHAPGFPDVMKVTLDFMTMSAPFATLMTHFRLALSDLRATMSSDLKVAFCAHHIAHISMVNKGFLLARDVLGDTDVIYAHAHVCGHRLSTLPQVDMLSVAAFLKWLNQSIQSSLGVLTWDPLAYDLLHTGLFFK